MDAVNLRQERPLATVPLARRPGWVQDKILRFLRFLRLLGGQESMKLTEGMTRMMLPGPTGTDKWMKRKNRRKRREQRIHPRICAPRLQSGTKCP
jgi:hypothetical protein